MILLNDLKANTIIRNKDFTSKNLSKKWPILIYPQKLIGFKEHVGRKKIKELKLFDVSNKTKELCIISDRCKITYRDGIFWSSMCYITSIAFKSEKEFTIFALKYNIGEYVVGRRVE